MGEVRLPAFDEQLLEAVQTLRSQAYMAKVAEHLEALTGREVGFARVAHALAFYQRRNLLSSRRRVVDGRTRIVFTLTLNGLHALSPTKTPAVPPNHAPDFIKVLLDRLPKPGDDWPAEARAKWLRAAASIFDLVYEGDSDIEISPRN